MRGLWVVAVLFTSSAPSLAGFEGTYGHVFEIMEEDLLNVLEARLKRLQQKGALKDLHQDVTQKTLQKLQRPKAVPGLLKAAKEKTWTFDPSLNLSKDLQDHRGQVFYKAGTRVNPLNFRSLSKRLLFLDGDDPAQVAWAKEHEEKSPRSLWILVKGSPFVLFKEKRAVFFDQMGVLVRKLGISHIPASVIQEGKHLRITEHVLQGSKR